MRINNCVCCNSKKIKKIKIFNKPPKIEPNYGIKNYYRELHKCLECENFFNLSKVDMNKIYEKGYSKISYGDDLWSKLYKIYNLKKKSDNFHRVNRILEKYKNFKNSKNFSVLDIGTGFGLFLYALKKENKNWKLQAVEPDLQNIKFLKKKIKN